MPSVMPCQLYHTGIHNNTFEVNIDALKSIYCSTPSGSTDCTLVIIEEYYTLNELSLEREYDP